MQRIVNGQFQRHLTPRKLLVWGAVMIAGGLISMAIGLWIGYLYGRAL